MKELIIVLGRSEELKFKLSRKLTFSYLDFFKEIPQKEDLEFELKNYLRRPINSNNCQEFPIFILKESDLQSIYFIDAPLSFPYFKGLKIELLACILNTLNKFNLLDYAQDKVYYLCHDNHFDVPTLTEKRIEGDEKKDVISSINNLLNIDISINRFFIATFYHEKDKSKIFTALKAANKKEWEDFNIEALLNGFDRQLLEEQKKRLIDIFLPLAIDAQGLKEVVDDSKKQTYLSEVLQNIKVNADEISTNWDEIKTVLGLNVSSELKPKEALSELYRFSDEEKKILYFPLESDNNPGINKKMLLEYFRKSNEWEGDMFLPNWLHRTVSKFEKKISLEIKK